MTHVFDVTALLSLLWPLALCAVAWGIMVWALRQRDAVSEAVDGLLTPRPSEQAAAGATSFDREREKPFVERSQRTHRADRSS